MTEEVKTEDTPEVVEAPQPQAPQVRIAKLSVDLLTKAKPIVFVLGKDGCTMIGETGDGFVIGFGDGSGCIVPRSSIALATFKVVSLEDAVVMLKTAEAPKQKPVGGNVISFAEASQKYRKGK